MIKTRRLTWKSAPVRIGFALCAVACSGTASADTSSPRYEMHAISDAAQGDRILAGDYTTAIRNIDTSKRYWLDRFFAATNLCVAYVVSSDFGKAAPVCDLSVAVIEARLANQPARRRSSRSGEYLRFMAIALSNRGVLKALRGDKVAARADFTAARNATKRLKSPETNLVRLALDAVPTA